MIVNLFDSAVKYLLVAKYHNQFIICPDNGLLTMITGKKPDEMVAIAVTKESTLLQLTQLVAEKLAAIHNPTYLSVADAPFGNRVENTPLRATCGQATRWGLLIFRDHFENRVHDIRTRHCN